MHPDLTDRAAGGHPNALSWDWVKCRSCELRAVAEANPPKDAEGNALPGYHLTLRYVGPPPKK